MTEYSWLEFPKGIPQDRWGKDHKSTLLYAESRAVDNGGRLRPLNMRVAAQTYPTRLTNDDVVYGHTDYMCLLDAQAAGLLSQVPEEGDDQTPVVFTEAGLAYVAALRLNRHSNPPNTVYGRLAHNWIAASDASH